MEERNILRHEKSKPRKRKKEKKPGRFSSTVKAIIIIFVIAVITVGLAFLYKIIIPEYKGDVPEDGVITYSAAHTFESVSYKNSFIINTIDGIKILNKKGEEINDSVASSISSYVKGMKEPVFCSNNKTVLIYDILGKTAVLFNEAGLIQSYNFPGDIITGNMSDSGYFSIVIKDAGSKAAVKAFSDKGTELLTWYSGKGYVSDAVIHNSHKRMAVVTNEIDNGEISSKILLFSLDNPEPYMGKIIGSSLCTAVSFYNETIYAICENGIYFIDRDNNINLAYNYSGEKVKHFKFFDNGNLLLISENTVSNNYRGIVLNKRGKISSDFKIESFLDIADAGKNEFLVIKRKGVYNISHKGKIKDEILSSAEVKDAKYFGDKVAMMTQDKIIFE